MVGKEKNLNLGIVSDQIGSNGGVNETQFVEFYPLWYSLYSSSLPKTEMFDTYNILLVLLSKSEMVDT